MLEDKQIWLLVAQYFDGFKTKFNPDIFDNAYHNYGPMKDEIKGSKDKQVFLKEMDTFAAQAPLDKNKGDKGIMIMAKSYDKEKALAMVFYQMYFKSGLILDVVDVFKIRNQKIVEITGVFDPRPFLE